MTRLRPATIDRLDRLWLAIVGGALALFAAMSAQAAWRAIEAHPRSAVAAASIPNGTTAADPRDRSAAPAIGTTGTIALPPLPAAASFGVAVETGVVAARPFSLASASPIDRGRALDCLTAAVYYEAASEPDAGQQAVAQVVLNRVRHPAFPANVCGVVYQGSAQAGCQFSFACDGAMRRVPAIAAWARAARIAAAALAGRVYAPVGLATHYHTAAVTPAWNRALVMTDAVGAHFFHRWKGWWGTPAAFTQRYAGNEPRPESGAALAIPKSTLAPAAPVLPVAAAATADIRPAFIASGTPIPAPAAADRLPPASTILDRWRESGQPLR